MADPKEPKNELKVPASAFADILSAKAAARARAQFDQNRAAAGLAPVYAKPEPEPAPEPGAPAQEPEKGVMEPEKEVAPAPTVPPSKPVDPAEQQRIAQKARVHAEGRKLQEKLVGLVSTNLERGGGEMSQEGFDIYMEGIREKLRNKETLRESEYEIARIDAMANMGVVYKDRETMRNSYAKDWLDYKSSENVGLSEDAGIATIIDSKTGKEIGQVPNDPNNVKLGAAMAGTRGAVGVLVDYTPEEEEVIRKVSEYTPEQLAQFGLRQYSAFREDGPTRRRQVTVFTGETSDGSFGYDAGHSKRVFTMYESDRIAHDKYKTSFFGLDENQRREVYEEARVSAHQKVARIVNRVAARGGVVVDTDIHGTVDRIMDNPEMWWQPFDGTALAVLEWANPTLGEYAKRAMRPWTALWAPVMGQGQTEGITYGTSAMEYHSPSPLWETFRIGPGNAILSWALDDRDIGWGEREQVEKLVGGYDYISDRDTVNKVGGAVQSTMPGKLFTAIATKTPWLDEQGAKTIMGVAPLLGLALVEPDLFSVASMGLGKGVKGLNSMGRAATISAGAGNAAADIMEIATRGATRLEDFEPVLAKYPHLRPVVAAHYAAETAQATAGTVIKKLGDTAETAAVATAPEKIAEAAAAQGASVGKAEERTRKVSKEIAAAEADLKQLRAEQKKKINELRQDFFSASREAQKEAEAIAAKLDPKVSAAFKTHTADLVVRQEAKRALDLAQAAVDSLRALPPNIIPPRVGQSVTIPGFDGTFTFVSRNGDKAVVKSPTGATVEWDIAKLRRVEPIDAMDADALLKLRTDLQDQLGRVSWGSAQHAETISLAQRLSQITSEVNIAQLMQEHKKATKALAAADARVRTSATTFNRLAAKQTDAYDTHVRVVGARRTREAKTALLTQMTTDAKNAGKKLERLRVAQAKLLAAQRKLLDAQAPVVPPLDLSAQVTRKVMLGLASDLKALSGVIRKTGDATPVSRAITPETSVTRMLETAASGEEIVVELEKRYGARDSWGLLKEDPLFNLLMSVKQGNKVTALQQIPNIGKRLLDLEQRVQVETAARDLWVTHRMEGLGKAWLDPSNVRRGLTRDLKYIGIQPSLAAAEMFRMIDGARRAMDPWYQRVGEVSKEMRVVAEEVSNRLAAARTEIGQILAQDGSNLDTVMRYLSSAEAIPLRDGVTAMNRVGPSFWEKFVAVVRAAGPDDDIPALRAVARAFVPPGHYGVSAGPQAEAVVKKMMQDIQAQLVDTTRDPGAAIPTIAEVMHKVKGTTFRVEGTLDADQVAKKFFILGILDGAGQYDLRKASQKVMGFLTPEQVRGMNYLMSGGQMQATGMKGISATDAVDLEHGYAALNRLGYVFSSDKVHRHKITGAGEATTMLHKWMEKNEIGATPRAMIDYIDQSMGKFIKELEASHEHQPWYTTGTITKWMSLLRRSQVMGLALPRFAQFTNQFFGDPFQIHSTVGAGPALRAFYRQLPMYFDVAQAVPGVPTLTRVAFGTDRPGMKLSGTKFWSHLTGDPVMNDILSGRPGSTFIKGRGEVPNAVLHEEMKRAGVFDFIQGRELDEFTSRLRRESGFPELLAKWPERWASVMEDLQARVRAGFYLDMQRAGKTPDEARELLKEALFDWRHALTPVESQYISKFVAFYSFWRNAFKQVNYALLEGVTTPTAEYLGKAMTGRTKLARMRNQARVAGAIPEWMYLDDDPDEVLDDQEQLWEWAKHQAPWWLAARPFLGNTRLTDDQVEWNRENVGRDVWVQSRVLPMLTALDTIHLYLSGVQTAAASFAYGTGVSTVAPTSDAAVRLSDQFTEMLIPVFSELVTASAHWAMGDPAYDSFKGVPLREGEVVALKMAGLLEHVAEQAPDDEQGRWWISGPMHNLTTLFFRSIPVIATELPNYAAAFSHHSIEEGKLSKAYLTAVATDLTGFAKSYLSDPFKGHDQDARRIGSELKSGEKELEWLSKGKY